MSEFNNSAAYTRIETEIVSDAQYRVKIKLGELHAADQVKLYPAQVKSLLLSRCRDAAQEIFNKEVRDVLNALLGVIRTDDSAILEPFFKQLSVLLHDSNGYGDENAQSMLEYQGVHSRVLVLVNFLRYGGITAYDTVHEDFFLRELCVEYVMSKIIHGCFLKENIL